MDHLGSIQLFLVRSRTAPDCQAEYTARHSEHGAQGRVTIPSGGDHALLMSRPERCSEHLIAMASAPRQEQQSSLLKSQEEEVVGGHRQMAMAIPVFFHH